MSAVRTFGRALLLRCPRCGARGVVRFWARLPEACPGCGHSFEHEEGYWLGAVAVNTVAVMAAFAVVFVGGMVLTWPEVPWNGLLIATVAVSALFPIAFYPWAKTLWVALDLTFREQPPLE